MEPPEFDTYPDRQGSKDPPGDEMTNKANSNKKKTLTKLSSSRQKYPPSKTQTQSFLHGQPTPITKTKTNYRDDYHYKGVGVGVGGRPTSRDDDSAVHATQYCASRLGSSDINSKLEALTAKSHALRAMSPPTQKLLSYSSTTTCPSLPPPPPPQRYPSSTYSTHPPVVPLTTSSEVGIVPSGSHARLLSRSTVPSVSSCRLSSTESVDSRLEYLTGMSRTIREGSTVAPSSLSSPTSVANPFQTPTDKTYAQEQNRKVTWFHGLAQQHYQPHQFVDNDERTVAAPVGGCELRSWGSDDLTVVGNNSSPSARNSSKSFVNRWNPNDTPPPASYAVTGSVAYESSLSAGDIADRDTSTATTTMNGKGNPLFNRSLAMKVLCAKILTGYTMSRNHCPDCTMAYLCKKPTDIGLDPGREECAYCPFDKLRKTIIEAVAKQIAASSRSSPGYDDLVCSISDEVCIEIAREQGRGGTMNEHRRCVDCRIPKLFYEDGSTWCVLCDVVKEKLGVNHPTSIAEANNTFGPHTSKLLENSPVTSQSNMSISKVPSFTSSTYDLTKSTSIKPSGQCVCPTDHPESDTVNLQDQIKENFANLQDMIQEERDKVSALQESIMNATKVQSTNEAALSALDQEPVNQDLQTPNTEHIMDAITAQTEQVFDTSQGQSTAMPSAAEQDPAEVQIVTDDEGLPINLEKLQQKLSKVIKRLGKCDVLPDMSPVNDLAKLQSQLKSELAKAKESQAALELTLQTSQVASSSVSSIDELITELDKVKQDQITLERIIEGTNFIEKATSDDPGLASSVTDELVAALRNHSYSISQQEVDATGNVKEYIPPPSYFQANIPSEITVYHIPEVTDPSVAPSVAAQSHHTQNLKRSERIPPPTTIHCCFLGKKMITKTQQPKDDDNYDCDTIETDDYTAEYTLNTMDDSRLIKCQGAPIDKQSGEKKENRSKPKSSKNTCFFSFFDCGGDEDGYSMVERSERGIRINEPKLPAHPHHLNSNVAFQEEQPWGSSSGDPNSGHYDPPGYTDRYTPRTPRSVESDYTSSPYTPSPYTPSPESVDDSDFGSMNRAAREVITKRTAFVNSAGSEVMAEQTKSKQLNDNTVNGRGPHAVLRVGGRQKEQCMRSPSPLSDWDSVNNGSDMGSINRVYASPNKTQPKSILRLPLPRFSDHHSVQSDLTDFSSVNRKVKFGPLYIDGRVEAFGSSRRGDRVEQQHLRVLTEESGSLLNN